jgi:hypothetical protein
MYSTGVAQRPRGFPDSPAESACRARVDHDLDAGCIVVPGEQGDSPHFRSAFG